MNYQIAQSLCKTQFDALRDRVNAKWANIPDSAKQVKDATGADIIGGGVVEDIFEEIVKHVYEPLNKEYVNQDEWLENCAEYKRRVEKVRTDANIGNASWMWVFPELLMKHLRTLGIVMDVAGRIMGPGPNITVPCSVFLFGECEARNIFGKHAHVHQMMVITYEKEKEVAPFKLSNMSSRDYLKKFGERLQRDEKRRPILLQMTSTSDEMISIKSKADAIADKNHPDYKDLYARYEELQKRHRRLNKELEELNALGPYEFGLCSTLGKIIVGPSMLLDNHYTDEKLLQNDSQNQKVADLMMTVKKQKKIKMLVTVRDWL